MKKLTAILITLCFIIQAQAQKHTYRNILKYPSYIEVVNHVFDHYSMPSEYVQELKLAKKRDGWHLLLLDLTTEKREVKKDYFVWSLEGKRYLELDLEAKQDGQEKLKARYLQSSERVRFNFIPYYGYANWDKDVIDDFPDYLNLPDTVLYGVGRAYGSYSTNLLNPTTGYYSGNYSYNLGNTQDKMTSEQLKEYRYYRHKAIEIFNEVEKRSPDMTVLVGSISCKADNEQMATFLDLLIYSTKEEAMKEIKEDMYDEYTLAFAKNLLAGCEKNGVLFTNGDNDTYIPLYVQVKEGFRTDVTIVNLSLLNIGRYIESLKVSAFGAKPINTFTSFSDMTDKSADVVYVTQSNEESLKVNAFLNHIYRSDKSLSDLGFGKKVRTVETVSLEVEGSENNLKIEWPGKYLVRSDMAVLDIIQSNWGERPIHFATTISNNVLKPFENYLTYTGFNYVLTAEPVFDGYKALGRVDETTALEFLNAKMYYPTTRATKMEHFRFGYNYQMSAMKVAEFCKDYSGRRNATAILDQCVTRFPTICKQYNYFTIQMAEMYMELEKVEKGKELLLLMLNNEETMPEDRFATHNVEEQQKTLNKFVLQIANKYNVEEVATFLESKNE